MILAFSLSMLFLFDLDLKSSTWLLEGAAPGGPVHRPARRSVARRRDDEFFSWWWAISTDSLQHPGWFCDILSLNRENITELDATRGAFSPSSSLLM